MKRIYSKIIKGLAVTLAPEFCLELQNDTRRKETLVIFKWWDVGADRPMVYHTRVKDIKEHFKDPEKIITDVAGVYRWHMMEMCRDATSWQQYVSAVAHGSTP